MRAKFKLAPAWIGWLCCLPLAADEPALEPIPFAKPLQIATTDLPADEPAPLFEILPESAVEPSASDSATPPAPPATPDTPAAAGEPGRDWRPSFALITDEPPTLPPQGYRSGNSNITYSQRWVFDASQGVYVPESITVTRRPVASAGTTNRSFRVIEQTPNGNRYRASSQPYGANYAGNQQARQAPIQAQVLPAQPVRRPVRPTPAPGQPPQAQTQEPPPPFVPGQPIRNAIRRRHLP